MAFDKTNTFTLNINDKQGNDKWPDRCGTLNVAGVEYFMDGWLKDGPNGPFLSGKIKRKDKQPTAQAPAKAERQPGQDDDPDGIPF